MRWLVSSAASNVPVRYARMSSYEQVISGVVRVVEAFGAAIMVLGGLGAFLVFASRVVHTETAHGSYEELRRNLSRCILLGLEVLIVADIVRTIIVDPTIESVAVLGIIVVIRILLSFSLEVEIDGVWPWRRWELARPPNAKSPPTNPQAPPHAWWSAVRRGATSRVTQLPSDCVQAGGPRRNGCLPASSRSMTSPAPRPHKTHIVVCRPPRPGHRSRGARTRMRSPALFRVVVDPARE